MSIDSKAADLSRPPAAVSFGEAFSYWLKLGFVVNQETWFGLEGTRRDAASVNAQGLIGSDTRPQCRGLAVYGDAAFFNPAFNLPTRT